MLSPQLIAMPATDDVMIATDTDMPTLVDRDTFLTSLRASELITQKQLDRALQTLPPVARSARDVADHFLKADFLSRFQIERLLAGRTDGFHIGPYAILDYLGKSATGRVYKARHRTMNRLVAIKILAHEQTATEVERAGIRAEARSAARLAHTNIVTLLDANQAGDRMYFVKEYLDGSTLEALVRSQGPLPIRRACEYVRQAASGLQHAHELGVSHGRLSPTAILVGRAGGKGPDDKPLVKVSGFGLGRLGADNEEPDFEYRAPEHFAEADPATASADLYSLGCVLHYLLAGRPPCPATRAEQAAALHRQSPPQPLGDLRPDVPAPLANFVLRLLNKDPRTRPLSAGEVARFLQCYADGGESAGTVDFSISSAPVACQASLNARSLPGVLADLPHEPILFDDDLNSAPTLVFGAIDAVALSEQPTLRSGGLESTPLTLSNGKTKPIPKPKARKKLAKPGYGRPPTVSPLALGVLVVGVCLGVLFAIGCILKIYAVTK